MEETGEYAHSKIPEQTHLPSPGQESFQASVFTTRLSSQSNMTLVYNSYTRTMVDDEAQCICHQASGDSPSCPYHYPMQRRIDNVIPIDHLTNR